MEASSSRVPQLSAESARPFHPAAWTRGGHRQTLLGFWTRAGLRWPLPSEERPVDAAPDVRLLLRASWQSGARDARPALLLVHGLGGTDASGYVVATGLAAYRRGWHVVRMNMRGSGDGLLLCQRLYNAGLDGDVVAALRAVATQAPRLALVGFSLGANQALLALGRREAQLPAGLLGAVAVSAPLDLAACADALERRANRLYQHYFMKALRVGYRERHALRPDLFPAGRERGLSTVREYDEAITAPHGGFASAAEYYERSSAGPQLAAIRRPTLLLSAADDPMIPVASVRGFALPPGGHVLREIEPTGGHVGFVGPSSAPRRFWAAERALAFLDALERA
jgi:predicted alpha/beta-fold hydrolase